MVVKKVQVLGAVYCISDFDEVKFVIPRIVLDQGYAVAEAGAIADYALEFEESMPVLSTAHKAMDDSCFSRMASTADASMP